MSDYPYDVLLVTPLAGYAAARSVFAAVTQNPADATAEWREASDGTRVDPLDEESPLETTHRVCHTAARASTVAALPALAAQIPGAQWCVTREGVGTEEERPVESVGDCLARLDLEWKLPPEESP